MADTKMIPINPGFSIDELLTRLTQSYQAKGFEVVSAKSANGCTFQISKDDSGIKKYVGLALGITATFSIMNGSLMINFSDSEWLGKIVGFIIGWFLCLIPCIFAIVGAVKQVDLPKNIMKEVQMIIAGMDTTPPPAV